MSQGSNVSDSSGSSGTSGKTIIFVLFPLALLLCSMVFLVGLREKRMRLAGRPEITASEDAAMRDLLDSIPSEWTRISSVQGQGWVIYVPCGSGVGTLRIAPDSTAPSSPMGLQCAFCDSLHAAHINKVLRFAGGDKLELDLGSQGTADAERVDDAVAQRFANAPVKDFVLIWRPSGMDNTDSLVFVPTSQANEFETLKADDEAAQGCGEKTP